MSVFHLLVVGVYALLSACTRRVVTKWQQMSKLTLTVTLKLQVPNVTF